MSEAKQKKERTQIIHGQEYRVIPGRVCDFRNGDIYKGWALETEIIYHDETRVVAKTVIKDCDGIVRSTGHAEKIRDSGPVEKTSAVEFAETSSVGRALGLLDEELMGMAIASAEEMQDATDRQETASLIEYNGFVREFWPSINACKEYLIPQWGNDKNQHNVTAARECLKELGDDIYRKLWKAPTKGGCFTTLERDLLKQPPEDSL